MYHHVIENEMCFSLHETKLKNGKFYWALKYIVLHSYL
jgi:hypothetical protein